MRSRLPDLLEDIARRPRHDRGDQCLVVRVRGQHDAGDLGDARSDLAADLDAAAVREPDVEDGDLRLGRRESAPAPRPPSPPPPRPRCRRLPRAMPADPSGRPRGHRGGTRPAPREHLPIALSIHGCSGHRRRPTSPGYARPGTAPEDGTRSPGRAPGSIVVGIDGSAGVPRRPAWAARQADLTGSVLEIVMTWEWPTSFGWAVPVPEDFDPEAEVRRTLETAVGPVVTRHPGVAVDAQVVDGHPAPTLVEASKDADLLVVGSRGHGRVRRHGASARSASTAWPTRSARCSCTGSRTALDPLSRAGQACAECPAAVDGARCARTGRPQARRSPGPRTSAGAHRLRCPAARPASPRPTPQARPGRSRLRGRGPGGRARRELASTRASSAIVTARELEVAQRVVPVRVEAARHQNPIGGEVLDRGARLVVQARPAPRRPSLPAATAD